MGIIQSKLSAVQEFRIPCELSEERSEHVLDFRKVRSLVIQAAKQGKYVIIEKEGKKVANLRQSTLTIENNTKDLIARVEVMNRPDQLVLSGSHATVKKSARLSYVILENPVNQTVL